MECRIWLHLYIPTYFYDLLSCSSCLSYLRIPSVLQWKFCISALTQYLLWFCHSSLLSSQGSELQCCSSSCLLNSCIFRPPCCSSHRPLRHCYYLVLLPGYAVLVSPAWINFLSADFSTLVCCNLCSSLCEFWHPDHRWCYHYQASPCCLLCDWFCLLVSAFLGVFLRKAESPVSCFCP